VETTASVEHEWVELENVLIVVELVVTIRIEHQCKPRLPEH